MGFAFSRPKKPSRSRIVADPQARKNTCRPINDFLNSESVPREYRLEFDLAFRDNFCLRNVAWIRPAYLSTKRGDVGTTSPTVLARREPLSKQSKDKFASLQHHPLIIAQAWKVVLGVTSRKEIRSIASGRNRLHRPWALNEFS